MNFNEDYIHIPVLKREVIHYLNLSEGEVVVDVTAGSGGHLSLIANTIGKNGKIIAIDKDLNAHKSNAAGGVAEKFKDRIIMFHDSFSALSEILKNNKIKKINALLCDLGISSNQIDIPNRGFSFMRDGPIDMRMNQKQKITAYEIIKNTSEKRLADIIYEFGEEKQSRKIAKYIKNAHPMKNSTLSLSNIIISAVKNRKTKRHPSAKTFQAIRIETNNELKELDNLLKNFSKLLAKNGRAVFISFHSLEDRMIKHKFKELSKNNKNELQEFKLLNKKVIRPKYEEILLNSRSRSAKLRAIIKQI